MKDVTIDADKAGGLAQTSCINTGRRRPQNLLKEVDMAKRLAMIAIVLCFLIANSFGNDEKQITGVWNTANKRAKIEVFSCGGHTCGKIVWLGQPLYPEGDKGGMGGKPRMDRDNPDPELRSRPLLGLQIMQGFQYIGNNTWANGTIYDPESGKTYKAKITLISPRRLELRGYVGIPLFGKTSNWTR